MYKNRQIQDVCANLKNDLEIVPIVLLGVDDFANRSLPLVALGEAVVTQLAGDAADAWCFVTVDAQLLQRQRPVVRVHVTIYYLAMHERFMPT